MAKLSELEREAMKDQLDKIKAGLDQANENLLVLMSILGDDSDGECESCKVDVSDIQKDVWDEMKDRPMPLVR